MERIKNWLVAFLILGFTGATAQVWRPLDNGLPATPLAMTADRNNVYVAHAVNIDNKGNRVFSISIWNGVFWRNLPSFTADSFSTITSLQVYQNHLYIGGKFQFIDGLKNAKNIFRWNGKEYQSITPKQVINPAFFGIVNDLDIYNNKLIIAGYFNEIQEVKANNIIAFDGSKYISPGNEFGLGPNGMVNDLLVANDSLYFCGAFSHVSGEQSKYIGAYGGNGFRYFKENTVLITKLAALNKQLFAFGSDSAKNKKIILLKGVNSFDASKAIEFIGDFNDMIPFEGNLYACGSFQIAGEFGAQNIIKYDKGVWQAIKGGNLGFVKHLVNYNGNLLIGGNFGYFGNLFLNRIALYDPSSNFISGKIFYDKNSNCQFDGRDENISDRFVILTPGPYIIKTDATGNFRAFIPDGKYKVTVANKKYWNTINGCKSSYDIELREGTVITDLDFALSQESDINDVKITLTNSGGWHTSKGKTNLYILTFENLGSNQIKEGKIKMRINKEISQIKSFPKADSSNNEFLYWGYNNLSSGEVRKIEVYLTIPTNFSTNEINLEAEISSQQSESSNEDNKDSIAQKVNGLGDVEFGKQVFPSPSYPDSIAYIAPTTTELAYTITFANYGTDTVRNVYIIDTLDLNIAMQFTQEIGASHPYTTRVLSGPPGSNLGILVWTFNNINLKPNPSKAGDFIGDKGFISFKVKLKEGLANGVIIKNKANVVYDYDDFNSTNFVYSQIDKTVGIEQVKLNDNQVLVYPNPFTHSVQIYWPNQTSFSYSILDALGKIVYQGKHSTDEALDVHHLSTGIYFIRLMNDQGQHLVKKIVKQ